MSPGLLGVECLLVENLVTIGNRLIIIKSIIFHNFLIYVFNIYKKRFFNSILLVGIGVFGISFFLKTYSDPLSKITSNEKQQLEFLFRALFFRKHFAYVLLGDKPVATAGHFTVIPLGNLSPNNYTFNQEWEIWEKHKHRFRFKNHLLIQLPHPGVKDLRSITFINKKYFLHVVRENVDLFQKQLGQSLTPENFLTLVEEASMDLYEIVGRNEALYGILLGYGRNNSLRFQRYFEIYSRIRCVQTRTFSLKWPQVSPGFSSLEEEFEALQGDSIEEDSYEDVLRAVEPVHFSGDPNDPETARLRQKYKTLQRKITQFYSDGRVLEKTIQLLLRP